jgi:amino acid transporter
MHQEGEPGAEAPSLTRSFGLLHATALNMANMVGVGPFITIPLLMAAMGGPQSLLGWLVGALIVVCDGQVWSELGAALPGSGGSYRFLREAYGRDRWGRLMAFLFIWQFILSGPLEIASGLIGFGQYATYLWPGLAGSGQRLMSCYWRDYDGSWSMPSFPLASVAAPSHWIGAVALRRTVAANTWNAPTASTAGSDFGTANTGHSATTGSLTTHQGGFLVIGSVTNDNVTATGVSFSSRN